MHRVLLVLLELPFLLLGRDSDLSIECWNALFNMPNQNDIQSLCQIGDPKRLRLVFVNRVLAEKLFLTLESFFDRDVVDDVLLRAALDTVVSELQWVDTTLQELKSVRSLIHQVDLSDNTDRSFTLWVDLSRKLQSVRVSNVLVRC